MNKKRNWLQIMYDMLKAIQDKNGRIKPTHILYKSNLSHQMLEEYLTELLTKGFVTEESTKKGRTYSLTQKGFDYLAKYRVIADFMGAFGLEEEIK